MTDRESDYVMGGTEQEAMRLELQALAMGEVIDREIEALDVQSGMQVLDAGCGSGAITRQLARKTHPAKVIGVDFDPVFIDFAKSLAADEDIKNIEYERADIDNLSYPDDSFDLTYSRLVLMHVRDPVKTVEELKRVTKKGGRVAVSDQDDDAMVVNPYMSNLMELWQRYGKWAKEKEMDRFIGKKLYSILSQAGLESIKIHLFSIYRTQDTPEEMRMLASVPIGIINGKRETLLNDKVFTEGEYRVAMDEFEALVTNPGAFAMTTFFLAIGTVPQERSIEGV